MIVDPLICVGIALLLFVLLITNVYTFAYWAHPDDKSQSYFVRGLIILGLQLSAMSVLMLPVGKFNVFALTHNIVIVDVFSQM